MTYPNYVKKALNDIEKLVDIAQRYEPMVSVESSKVDHSLQFSDKLPRGSIHKHKSLDDDISNDELISNLKKMVSV